MIRRPPRSTLFPYTTALPICLGERRHGVLVLAVEVEMGAARRQRPEPRGGAEQLGHQGGRLDDVLEVVEHQQQLRSEEHTSELQSRQYLVCRLLLEKKNKKNT